MSTVTFATSPVTATDDRQDPMTPRVAPLTDAGWARASLVFARRAVLKGDYLQGDGEVVPDSSTMSQIRQIVERLKLAKGRDAEKATLALTRAGMRSKDALVLYQFARLCLPLAMGLAGALLLYVLEVPKLPVPLRAVVTMTMVVLGAWVISTVRSLVAPSPSAAMSRASSAQTSVRAAQKLS